MIFLVNSEQVEVSPDSSQERGSADPKFIIIRYRSDELSHVEVATSLSYGWDLGVTV